MNNKVKYFWPALVLIVVFGAAACKTPPTEEMDRAIEAVTRAANDADAVNYAADTLAGAQDALNRMQAEADSKRYDSAKTLAAEAVSLAEKAIADGKTGAAAAREEAANLLSAIGNEITQTEGELDAAKKLENILLDTGTLDRDMASAAAAYEDAGRSLDASNYSDAVARARPIRPALAGIRLRISDAVTAASKKK